MINRCIGCGALFQSNDEKKEGYIDSSMLDIAKVCKRCFKIKNYGDYVKVDKSINDYSIIFDKIKKENKLILFLCDILTIDKSINEINNFNGNVILVITKKDLLPKSVKEYKLSSYIDNNYKLNILDKVFINSNKNYNLDLLMNLINKYKNDKEVYLVGNTNAGKSTLINAIIKAYCNKESFITTSIMPATTLDIIKIKLNDDLVLIDTPGIVYNENYITLSNKNDIKKIMPKATIKPRTYQIKPNESLIIDNYARIDYLGDEKNSFTLYISNDINVKRIKINTNNNLRNLKKHSFVLNENKDIVISGLCFCKVVKKAKVNVYVKDKISVYERPNLI